MPPNASHRAFKTARFSKDAKKSKIKDVELCVAIQQILLGQVDDLANSYAGLTENQVEQLLVNGDFVEICHDDKTKIQK